MHDAGALRLGQAAAQMFTARVTAPLHTASAAASGLDLSGIGWYQVFTAFKLAVIIQQIYIRYLRGQTTDQRFADYGQRVATLIDKAMVMTHT
jgi:aminoglycoside phosphotransferase (APT) family kinase protein